MAELNNGSLGYDPQVSSVGYSVALPAEYIIQPCIGTAAGGYQIPKFNWRDNIMKALTFAAILLACAGLSMVGCSDKLQSPVAPTDQAVQTPASPGKNIISEFTATEGPDLLNPAGYVVDPGSPPPPNKNMMIVRGLVLRNVVTATFPPGSTDLVTGHGLLEMNFTYDLSATEGVSWGKLTLDPDAPEAGDGVWEVTWNGKITLGASGFVCPTKWVGHGKGGAIDGMQFFSDENVMTIWSPFDGWAGAGTGYIKSH